MTRRRGFLFGLLGAGGSLYAHAQGAVPLGTSSPAFVAPLPRPLLRFAAGEAGEFDLSAWVPNYQTGVTRLRLRANPATAPAAAQSPRAFVSFESQFPEYSFDPPRLRYNGSAAQATTVGASAARLQIEATNTTFDDASAVTVSDIASIVVDAPLAYIKHGLDSWDTFDALTRAVRGTARVDSEPNGRKDLLGAVFELTPGMYSEGHQAGLGSPVAAIEFPCTVRAAFVTRRPVFRSVTGQRDILQIEARQLPPIDGEVVLKDLVIRDNRAWYNSGEAGVRIKDRFAGRSVRLERCEIIRCQNAVSGGSPGQTLRVLDCRIVDCGFGDQAHGLYVAPEWLEFFGNVISMSPGNRLARAHLLKTRALNSRIMGNRFETNDCAISYLIDCSNGGNVEIGGNLFDYGRSSDNNFATFIAYAPEGAGNDKGTIASRRFRLIVRNNMLVSAFPGKSNFIVIHNRWVEVAGTVRNTTFPNPLEVEDNVYWSRGPSVLVLQGDRTVSPAKDADLGTQFPNNARASTTVVADIGTRPPAQQLTIPNTGGAYAARRFTGHTLIGTGSAEHLFTARGAG